MFRRVLLVSILCCSCALIAQKPGGGGSKGTGSSSGATGGLGTTPMRGTISPSVYNNPTYNPLGSSYPGRIYDPTTGSIRVLTPQEDRVRRMMEKQRNLERQKAMKSDTEKLVQLATSLQQDVDKSGGSLSSDSEKKANQIEKLAKNVKNKMTGDN
ncbi:MAG: hypothetical protein NVS9B15_12490 [Acidobacteriaceae bacterium]